jgi:hypothetical protein
MSYGVLEVSSPSTIINTSTEIQQRTPLIRPTNASMMEVRHGFPNVTCDLSYSAKTFMAA